MTVAGRPPRTRIAALGRHHDRANFSCGKPSLDDYLKTQAGQDARRNVAAPFVLVEPGGNAVLGYYTLSSFGIDVAELPEAVARKLPRYPIVPATLLGRLAVDRRRRGEGLGERLLVDALRRAWRAAHEIASAAVVVDAIDDAAVRFYRHFDFLPLRDRPNRLYLPMETIGKLFPDRRFRA